MRIHLPGIGILLALLLPAAPAHAANQTVTATNFNTFNAPHVGVNVGEMVTWNNGGGLHNVHFDDNSFDMPASPSSAAWSVQRTFNTPGLYRYYCEAHGGPNGSGMSGTVAVNTGYVRPAGAASVRASLAVAFKQCTAANRQHGTPLANPSCDPPAQASDWVTIGAASAGFAKVTTIPGDPGTPADEADVQVRFNMTDVRHKAGLADYTGQLQTRLTLRITDRLNGLSRTEPATGDTTLNFTTLCAATGGAIGAACSSTTTADAVVPGAVPEGRRSVWALGKVEVFDGGSDGVVSTTPNTLLADQGVFVP
jgi:plastocyanin